MRCIFLYPHPITPHEISLIDSLIMKKYTITLCLIIICCLSISAQKITLTLNEMIKPNVGVRYIAVPIQANEENASFELVSGKLKIYANIHGDSLIYNIRDNSNKDIERFSFKVDSIVKWNHENDYIQHAYPFKLGEEHYFFIPGTAISYNDIIFQKYPCMVSDANYKFAEIPNQDATVYISCNNPPCIIVEEKGKIHTQKIVNDLHYKETYSLSDVIPIGNTAYKVDAFDLESDTISLIQITSNHSDNILQSDVLDMLTPYFKNRQILLVDFWGTWCKPCVEGLPKLKELHTELSEDVAILSICFDDTFNFEYANKLLIQNQIQWDNLFVSFSEPNNIVERLGITSFPTYLIIDTAGSILYRDSGDTGYNNLLNQLNDYRIAVDK